MAYKTNEMRALLVATIAPAKAVDRAMHKATESRQAMAEYALKAIRNGELTIEQFKDEMLAAYVSKLSKAKAKECTALKHCGNTYAGIYYDIRRVAEAGKEAMARVADKGEAITSVRRDCKATQKQTRKNSKGKGKPRAITLEAALDGLESWIADAIKGGPATAKELASNPRLSGLVAKLAELETAANAKPAKATRRRRRKAA